MSVSQYLSVTEVAGSVDNSANTSKVRILWQSTQSGESRWLKTGTYGKIEYSYYNSKLIKPFNELIK